MGVLLGDPADLVVGLAAPGAPGRAAPAALDDPHAGVEAQMPQPAEIQGQHRQHHALRRKGLGRGDADFRAGVQIDAAVGLLGDRAADHVADGQRRMPFALHFLQRGQRVGRLAALRDGEQQRVVVQRRIAIAQLAGVFHFDRNPGQILRSDIRRPWPRANWCRRRSARMRLTERSCCGVRFRPPNTAVASSQAQAGRAWRCRIDSGCSKISLSM